MQQIPHASNRAIAPSNSALLYARHSMHRVLLAILLNGALKVPELPATVYSAQRPSLLTCRMQHNQQRVIYEYHRNDSAPDVPEIRHFAPAAHCAKIGQAILRHLNAHYLLSIIALEGALLPASLVSTFPLHPCQSH